MRNRFRMLIDAGLGLVVGSVLVSPLEALTSWECSVQRATSRPSMSFPVGRSGCRHRVALAWEDIHLWFHGYAE